MVIVIVLQFLAKQIKSLQHHFNLNFLPQFLTLFHDGASMTNHRYFLPQFFTLFHDGSSVTNHRYFLPQFNPIP
jgi:hypothetical protein